MAAKRRQTIDYINVRLSSIHDDDISKWWMQQPGNTGGAAVKAAIRHYKASATDTTPANRADLIDMFQALNERLETQQRTIEQLVSVVHQLHLRIQAGGVVAAPATTNADQPRLTDDQQAIRKEKVLANRW